MTSDGALPSTLDDIPLPGLPPAPSAPPPLAGHWIKEGQRALLFKRPRLPASIPAPGMLLLLFGLEELLALLLGRLQVPGPAAFNITSVLAVNWIWLPTLWLAWWAFASHGTPAPLGAGRSARLLSWVAVTLSASLVPIAFICLLEAALAHGLFTTHTRARQIGVWAVLGVVLTWMLISQGVLLKRLGAVTSRAVLVTLGLAGLQLIAMWQPMGPAWYADPARQAARSDEDEAARFHLNQQSYETQRSLWTGAENAIAKQRPGVVDVYGLVFAPYADDVFLREGDMVTNVLDTRFDAGGRVLRLQNHASTNATYPWATPENLQRAITLLADRMDKSEDVLIIYLTSHGGRDFHLAARHWPLEVDALTPQILRTALDQTGIQHRVIAISACYSGGWVEPLASDGTLVMTAADADHTSYGCGYKSPLTYFGRAMFDEQLRQTHSFSKAFAQAVPVIEKREQDGGKTDGFSNPQMRIGTSIAATLGRLEQRLDEWQQQAGQR